MNMDLSKSIKGVKQHYERLIVVLVFILLLVSALFLALQIGRAKRTFNVAGRHAPTENFKRATPMDPKRYQAVLRSLREPYQMAASNVHMMVSELRVRSVYTDIPYHAEVCPFSGVPQPKITEFDYDRDTMPDAYEKKHGLDPLNAEDAYADKDGDEFTNLEEFQGGTSSANAEDFPSPVQKLRALHDRGVAM
ncbi:MAG: hypothetical protein GKR87_15020 [Kiritimatiellae bacterium]|nr:hypothetical protein [Kiritimatiellia bacterium]